MPISAETIGSALLSAIGTLVIVYLGFRVKIESRIKDLENDLKLFEPIKQILLKKGSEHVEKVFKESK